MARKTHNDLEAVDKRHTRLQAELDQLYDSIFAGLTPGFLEEDKKESALRVARNEYGQTKQRLEAEMQVMSCLQNADEIMQQALSFLADARSNSRMDMFGGGTLSHMMERGALSCAANAVDKIKMLVSQTQRCSPNVGTLGPMDIAQGKFISDVLFDNVFSDMATHDEIEQSQAQCEQEAGNLSVLVIQARGRADGVTYQTNQAMQRVDVARQKLQATWQATFEKVARPPYDQTMTTSLK